MDCYLAEGGRVGGVDRYLAEKGRAGEVDCSLAGGTREVKWITTWRGKGGAKAWLLHG